jgi:hypothetical protein
VKDGKKVRAVKLLAILARGYVEGRIAEALMGWNSGFGRVEGERWKGD